MVKLVKKLIVSFVFSFLCTNLFAQDPQLSQFYASPIYTNPAFAGAAKKLRFTANIRNQYIGLNNNYKTAVAAIDAYVPKLQGGLATIISADQAGDGYLTTQTFAGIYAYNLSINRNWNANFGLQAEIKQRTYDFNKFTFGDQLDPVQGKIYNTSEIAGTPQRIYPNFSTGALIYSEKFYAGVAVHNLLEPNQSFNDVNNTSQAFILPRKYTANIGANISLTNSRFDVNNIYISPNLLFMKQRDFYQVNVGTYIKKQALTAGIWYRQTSKNADAIIFLFGLKFKNFRIGYSYDLTVSNAKTATIGSHEISIGFDIKTPPHSNSRMGKPIKCPDL